MRKLFEFVNYKKERILGPLFKVFPPTIYSNHEGNEADDESSNNVGNKTYTNTSGKIEAFLCQEKTSTKSSGLMRTRGFLQGVGYKLSAQKMSNAGTVKVDGRKGLSMRGTNGFTKLAVPEKHRIPTQNLVVVK